MCHHTQPYITLFCYSVFLLALDYIIVAMASSLAMKRLWSSNMLFRSLRPVCAVAQPCTSRLFNTNAMRRYDRDDRDLDVDRQSDRRVFSPFSGSRLLGPLRTHCLLPKHISTTKTYDYEWNAVVHLFLNFWITVILPSIVPDEYRPRTRFYRYGYRNARDICARV